jgi:hypothetical protein
MSPTEKGHSNAFAVITLKYELPVRSIRNAQTKAGIDSRSNLAATRLHPDGNQNPAFSKTTTGDSESGSGCRAEIRRSIS